MENEHRQIVTSRAWEDIYAQYEPGVSPGIEYPLSLILI